MNSPKKRVLELEAVPDENKPLARDQFDSKIAVRCSAILDFFGAGST